MKFLPPLPSLALLALTMTLSACSTAANRRELYNTMAANGVWHDYARAREEGIPPGSNTPPSGGAGGPHTRDTNLPAAGPAGAPSGLPPAGAPPAGAPPAGVPAVATPDATAPAPPTPPVPAPDAGAPAGPAAPVAAPTPPPAAP